MSSKIELILTPTETPFHDSGFFGFSPLPLSLGVLQGYLPPSGHTVSSTDLNTCMQGFEHSSFSQWLPLYDKNLISRHLTEGSPSGMEVLLATSSFIQESLRRGRLAGFHLNRYYIVPCSLLGSKPEQYGIRLHCAPRGYEKLLQRNAEILVALTAPTDGIIKKPRLVLISFGATANLTGVRFSK